MKCEVCGCEHDGSYGSGRFCSINCKQKFVGMGTDKLYVCKFCGKKYQTPTKLGGHITRCEKNPERKSIIDNATKGRVRLELARNPFIDRMVVCKKCGKHFNVHVREHDFAKGLYHHYCSPKCAQARVLSEDAKRRKILNLRKTYSEIAKKNGISYERKCIVCGRKYSVVPQRWDGWKSNRFCSNGCANKHMRKIISIKTIERCRRGEFGGINNDTYKKHKRGWYHGIYCGSSWELAFVIYHIDIGDKVVRCTKKLPYIYEGQIFNYYPDFDIGEETYEIKGYENGKAKAKHEQYPEIIVLRKKQMKPILKYVIGKYGKDFVRLLEKTDS